MTEQYELRENTVEILGPTSYIDEDGQTVSVPRRVNTAWVKLIYADDGTLESKSAPHRPGPVSDDDLDAVYTINPDGETRTGREIWEAAEAVTGTTLL